MVCRPVCTATTRFLVGPSKLLCFRFYETLCFPTYTTFTLPYNFSHQNVCVFNSLTEVLRSHFKNFAMLAGSEVLCSLIPSQRGGGRGIFSVQDLCDLSRILLSICSVTPFLDQVFRCFFSMDNLRVYGEDDAVSSSGLGRASTKLPSSSEGLPVTTSSQASVMAASTPATTLVTFGPVPAVSAPTTPASSVHKDCTVALDDLPPPPAEP